MNPFSGFLQILHDFLAFRYFHAIYLDLSDKSFWSEKLKNVKEMQHRNELEKWTEKVE